MIYPYCNSLLKLSFELTWFRDAIKCNKNISLQAIYCKSENHDDNISKYCNSDQWCNKFNAQLQRFFTTPIGVFF